MQPVHAGIAEQHEEIESGPVCAWQTQGGRIGRADRYIEYIVRLLIGERLVAEESRLK